jgi:hypothetical protein
MRCLPLLAGCCLAALAASGAPLPKAKPSAFQGPGWKEADPGKDCQFTFGAKDGSVTFTLPARKGRSNGMSRDEQTAPRLTRPAGEGDFDVQVRLRADFNVLEEDQFDGALLVTGPAAKGGRADRLFYALSGVWHDNVKPAPRARVVRLGPGGGSDTNVFKPWHRAVRAGGKELCESHLKVERRGEALKAYFSPDGEEWHGPYGHLPAGPGHSPVRYKGELRVGVAVTAFTDRAVEVTFDRFKLTPVKQAKGQK